MASGDFSLYLRDLETLEDTEMTLAQVNYAEHRMQQQWHDLVIAEQTGQPEEVLEQMFSVYMLLVEEFNACRDKHLHQRQSWCDSRAARRSQAMIRPTSLPSEQAASHFPLSNLYTWIGA